MTIRRVLLTCTGLLLALILAACGNQQPAAETAQVAPQSPAAEVAPQEPAPAATTVAVADSARGPHLIDASGRTLYLFASDTGGVSTCYDDCAANWPALIANGATQVSEGLDPALLGTTQRQDGQTQVTYNNWPLYYYAADQEPGNVNGQGMGDVWWVVSPEGTAVRDGEVAPQQAPAPEEAPAAEQDTGDGYSYDNGDGY